MKWSTYGGIVSCLKKQNWKKLKNDYLVNQAFYYTATISQLWREKNVISLWKLSTPSGLWRRMLLWGYLKQNQKDQKNTHTGNLLMQRARWYVTFMLIGQLTIWLSPWIEASDRPGSRYHLTLDPLSTHDALKHHFTSLKNRLNFPTTRGFRTKISM